MANISITSVQVTPSTCPNNGTATVFATSSNQGAVFLYNIVSGPVLYPLQNDSFFSSFSPGTYIARVHDVNSFDSAQITFSITGNYQSPAFNATSVPALCSNGNTGQIICNPTNATGLSPYSWQVISPYTGVPQGNDTLKNLSPGIYIVKLTDACFNTETQQVIVGSTGSGLSLGNYTLNFIGCDTIVFTQGFNMDPTYTGTALKVNVATSHGSTTKYQTPVSTNSGYEMIDTIYNITFGDNLTFCIIDTCNASSCNSDISIPPFLFEVKYFPVDSACNIKYIGDVKLVTAVGEYTINKMPGPVIITLTDTIIHVVADSVIHSDSCTADCPTVGPLIGGRVYWLSIKDYCGNVYQEIVRWPIKPPAYMYGQVQSGGCLDSTADCQFIWVGFATDLTLELLSGPASLHSSKQGFSYFDTIVYPILFTDIPNTGSFTIADMPPGTYHFRAFDSCGNTFTDSVIISSVSSFAEGFSISKNCGGLSTLTVSVANGAAVNYYIRVFYPDGTSYGSGSSAAMNSVSPGCTPGTYLVQFTAFNSGYPTLPGVPDCVEKLNTIVVPPISDSTLKATDIATCNGTIYIHVVVDSNSGLLPFQYEIISGPETASPQNSNTFMVQNYGTYVLGVIDGCGDIDVRQITIDTGKFSPVVKSGGWCAGSVTRLAEVASPFFTYKWTRPDNTVFTGDTLVIDPFTPADTGTYVVKKFVQINGCLDSAVGNYHLIFKDTIQQAALICHGDTFFVGHFVHMAAGVYADTLSGAYGCDSIVITTLNLLPIPPVAISPANPPVCHANAITLTASGGTSYKWSNLIVDSVITVNPSAITRYNVTVTDSSHCSATTSVLIYPSTKDSIQLNKALCPGDTLSIGRHNYTQAGNYVDTLTGLFGCDSVVYTTLFVRQSPQVQINPDTLPKCHYYPTALMASGGVAYRWHPGNYSSDTVNVNPGTTTVYTVTVSDTSFCSATASVTVYPVSDSVMHLNPTDVSICPSDSATICPAGTFSSYIWSNGDSTRCITVKRQGHYAVTAINNLGCSVSSDSVNVIVFTVNPVTASVHGDTLRANGQYASYQWYFNGSPIAGATSPTVIETQKGTYKVEATDSNGCSSISNSVVPTGVDGAHVEAHVRVFPNPTSNGVWQVELSDVLIGSHYEVFDVEGRSVVHGYFGQSQNTISLSKILSGMYLLKIKTTDDFYILRLIQF